VPELPDVELYCEKISERVLGEPIEKMRLASPFLLRSVDPPASAVIGKRVTGVRRLGKRIVLALEDDLFLVFHLMIAGRFRWDARGAKPPARIGLGAIDFPTGTLLLREASKKKRASLQVVRGAESLAEHDPGGLEVLDVDVETFARALRSENHTLKRALTDPRRFSGIGNAYSDEILHAARLSPILQTKKLDDEDVARLHRATRETLVQWTDRLRVELAGRFPGAGDVTAFRAGFAVHGRHRQPCPVCGSPVQRIRYADNETNYCATCQTGGRLLRDRALSRLLKDDWPDSLS
jgi:formamidopyrimidine-DNA glycosylase